MRVFFGCELGVENTIFLRLDLFMPELSQKGFGFHYDSHDPTPTWRPAIAVLESENGKKRFFAKYRD